jgi:hypothetical protein
VLELHLPLDRVSPKLFHELSSQGHQRIAEPALRDRVEVNWESIDLPLINVSAVRKGGDKPIEETRVQAAKSYLGMPLIIENQFLEF